MPRWRKVRLGRAENVADWLLPGEDLEGIAIAAAVLVGLFVVILVLVPLLLFGIELILLGLLLAAGVLGRALLRRPWVVRAISEDGSAAPIEWKVNGWLRSARLIEEVAQSLTAGLMPAPSEPAELLPGSAGAQLKPT